MKVPFFPSGFIGSIHLPGSKSITNRALLLAALAEGDSLLSGVLFAEDTELMITALRSCGVTIVEVEENTLRVYGSGGKLSKNYEPIFCGNAGTVMRFLGAALVLGEGDYTLVGSERMHERPIGDLVDALQVIGGKVSCSKGFPPLHISGSGLEGGEVICKSDKSSQFLSALLLVAPYARREVEICTPEKPVSHTYIEMTLQMMRAFQVEVKHEGYRRFVIPSGKPYQACEYAIEGDASSASYFFALAAIHSGSITVKGVCKNSLQGDLQFLDLLEEMGCTVFWEKTDEVTITGSQSLRGITADMRTISDTVPTLAAVALFAQTPTKIRNVANIRLKESDRISDLALELRKLGGHVDEFPDGLIIYPLARPQPALLDPHNDHRLAMAFAVIGTKFPGVLVTNPSCVQKTFPDFFSLLFSLLPQQQL